MAAKRLDQKLLRKICEKLNITDNAGRVRVSKKANKLGISSEASLVLLAKECGIGAATYQRKLDPHQQAEIRDSLPSIFSKESKPEDKQIKSRKKLGVKTSKRSTLQAAIDYLLQDQELHGRCKDILLARSRFDRPINQATLTLEDRIRSKTKPSRKLVGHSLVADAFKPDLSKTRFKVSDDDEEHQGFVLILYGMIGAFRNRTHHHLINSFTREDALRVCAFIDVLLRVVDKAVEI
jgi:uncharacterized protein (TIGR02391 family)